MDGCLAGYVTTAHDASLLNHIPSSSIHTSSVSHPDATLVLRRQSKAVPTYCTGNEITSTACNSHQSCLHEGHYTRWSQLQSANELIQVWKAYLHLHTLEKGTAYRDYNVISFDHNIFDDYY